MKKYLSTTVLGTVPSTILGTVLAAGVGATALAAPPEYHKAVALSGPILHYQLNETEGLAKNYGSLGAAFDAEYLGAPTRGVATSSGDTGVQFNGVDDFLQSLGVSPEDLTGNPTFTAEAVVRFPTGATALNWAPFLHWGASGTGNSVYFSVQNDTINRIFAGFYNGGLRSSSTVALDAWHHIVMVREGGGNATTGTTLYINGVAVAVQPDTDLCCNGLTPNVQPNEFRINRARDFTRFFTGIIDEVALYDYAFTESDVCEHYLALDICRGDLNGDALVGITDLVSVLASWGPCPDCPADIDENGDVGVSDLLAVLAAWGPCACQ